MAFVAYKEKTQTRRFQSKLTYPENSGLAPKRLLSLLAKHSGKNNTGKLTVRGQGGRHKRYYRAVDFKRDKVGVEGKVVAIEYDPNRTVNIALVKYPDGDFRYILAPQGLKVKDSVSSGEKLEINPGNCMKLKNMPVGTIVHNVELIPGQGGVIGRSAGTGLTLLAKEGDFANLRLPSGEVRKIRVECMATIGALGNEEWKNVRFGKAGRKRHMGIRPTVRGVAQDPNSHPHGGGEAKSGVGRKRPMTKFGRPANGKTRNKKNMSNKYIVKRRK